MTEVFGTYRVVSHVKPATVFRRPGGEIILRFPTPDRGYEIVTFKELGEKIGENFVPTGLEFRADVQALSIEEALPRGVSLADAICSFITLVSGVGLPIVQPILCYELTKGKSEREFRQFFDDATFLNPSKRVLPHEELIGLSGYTRSKKYDFQKESKERYDGIDGEQVALTHTIDSLHIGLASKLSMWSYRTV